MPDTIMIVSGETSGELYGSLLASALKKRNPDVRIIGVGGERMIHAGVELISGISSAFGIAEAISSLKALKETFRKAVDALKKDKPRVLVLIDYPDFNLRLAAEAKKLNIKILYYVSPQVWAWRKKRVKKIAALVDKMAVVLPFEVEIYKEAGLDCEFVGHPVFDEIKEIGQDKEKIKKKLGLKENMPLLSILPGSRPHELDRLLPITLDTIREFRKEYSSFQFCVPFAPNTDMDKYRPVIDILKHEGVVVNKGESLKVLAASDYAVIASGTASLQAVFLGVPIVVIYKLSPLSYVLARLIIKAKYAALVNLLSGREVVKELLQADATTVNITREIKKIMFNSIYKEEMMKDYDNVRKMFSEKNASDRVAEIAIQMAGWNNR
jgi:lipid-A-disaccharide synthase